jgi:hypothetical protein
MKESKRGPKGSLCGSRKGPYLVPKGSGKGSYESPRRGPGRDLEGQRKVLLVSQKKKVRKEESIKEKGPRRALEGLAKRFHLVPRGFRKRPMLGPRRAQEGAQTRSQRIGEGPISALEEKRKTNQRGQQGGPRGSGKGYYLDPRVAREGVRKERGIFSYISGVRGRKNGRQN